MCPDPQLILVRLPILLWEWGCHQRECVAGWRSLLSTPCEWREAFLDKEELEECLVLPFCGSEILGWRKIRVNWRLFSQSLFPRISRSLRVYLQGLFWSIACKPLKKRRVSLKLCYIMTSLMLLLEQRVKLLWVAASWPVARVWSLQSSVLPGPPPAATCDPPIDLKLSSLGPCASYNRKVVGWGQLVSHHVIPISFW